MRSRTRQTSLITFLPRPEFLCAGDRCAAVARDLRGAIQGKPRNGDIRLLHNLDTSIAAQLVQTVADLGGAVQMVAAAPFWDQGAAIDRLCEALGLDRVFVHAHAYGCVEGSAGSNWPAHCRSTVHPIRLEIMDAQGDRRLHAKAFEIICKRGRVLLSGSPNGTTAALGADQNVEACIVRIQRDRTIGWKFSPCDPPELQVALDAEFDKEDESRGVLRAVLEADEVHGEVLTPSMSGPVSLYHVSRLGPELLAETTLSADRQVMIAFDLTQYICERLQPEATRALAWLKRLVEALLKAGVPPERRNDVAAAVLTLFGMSTEVASARLARGYLLRLNVDISGGAPSGGRSCERSAPIMSRYVSICNRSRTVLHREITRIWLARPTRNGRSSRTRSLQAMYAQGFWY
jgi:hypothetical protein